MTIDIYLSSLSEYTNGNDNGEWLTLPMSNEELTDKFNGIVGKGKEWIILDSSEPSLVSEYEDVFSLNDFLLEVSKEFQREEISILSKVVDTFKELTKEEFLFSYSYLTEEEYDATMRCLKRRDNTMNLGKF